MRVGAGRAGFSGVQSCGSVWACPHCAGKIAHARREDVAGVLEAAAREDKSVMFVTLTARHHRNQRLKDTWAATAKAWRSMTSGRGWQSIAAAWGVRGFVKATEVTYGAAGWHVHFHVLVVLEDADVTQGCADRLAEALWPRWLKGLERQGYSALRGPGLDVRVASEAADAMGAYLTKSLVWETVAGMSKDGRLGGRSPFQLLDEVARTGDADALDLWHEWEQASKGKRQLTWSRGLREWARLGEELTDEQVAEQTVEGEDVLVLDADAWRAVAPVAWQLLDVAEVAGVEGAKAWLRRRGLSWQVPPSAQARAA
nr:protein rep [Arsenicicoccus piscis]